MDKVAPSKLTLAQEDEEKKEESGDEKAIESTTSTPAAESGSTDTSNVESVRSGLTGIQPAFDNNQKQLQFDNFGQPRLDFGNQVTSGQDLNNRSK
jgi:hypothetical protein